MDKTRCIGGEMRKTKKKDNPGANIGNALLGCIVLAVITVGFAIEMRKEGVGESAIMGIVFLSFFWAIMLAVLVTALWRRSHSDVVPKVRNLGPKAIVCLTGFFFATVGGGALFIEFSRALAKGTPLVSLEVLGMAAFLSIFFTLSVFFFPTSTVTFSCSPAFTLPPPTFLSVDSANTATILAITNDKITFFIFMSFKTLRAINTPPFLPRSCPVALLFNSAPIFLTICHDTINLLFD